MGAILRLVTDATPPRQVEQLVLRQVIRDLLGDVVEIHQPCRKRGPRKAHPDPVKPEQLDFIIVTRPKTYGECAELVPDVCPFVSCKHHLYLDVNPKTGRLKIAFPHLEPWQMTETCALRVVDKHGPLSARRVAKLRGITDRAVSKIEKIATKRFASVDDGD